MAEQISLFENLTPTKEKEIKFKTIEVPVWTESKAKLIQRYLYLFVMITRHGTYIDGFAGPQNEIESDSWSAKLVLESKPQWMRNFYLFDAKPSQYECLIRLKDQQEDPKRNIEVKCGDFNQLIHDILKGRPIRESEATFCLLDQRAFECDWSSVEAVANYKKEGRKIEIFYFLPTGWLDRSISGLANKDETLKSWYGNENWEEMIGIKNWARAKLFCRRFKEEFGYKYAHPWPIYEREGGMGKIMYFMIHATDHEEAPKLMRRAYGNIVRKTRNEEQLKLF